MAKPKVVPEWKLVVDKREFPIKVDPKQSFNTMVALGHYNYVNEIIMSGFLPESNQSKGKLVCQLVEVDTNSEVSEKKVTAGLANLGLRPANMTELLAFGAAYPKLQYRKHHKFPVVALAAASDNYIPYIGGASKRALTLFHRTGACNRIPRLLVVQAPPIKLPRLAIIKKTYPITVDYDQSLAQMIAADKFDLVHHQITWRHFRVRGIGQVNLDAVLVRFNSRLTGQEALAKLEKNNLRPATIAELLAFGVKYPDKQRTQAIVALGSSWENLEDGRVITPCLIGCEHLPASLTGRLLDLIELKGHLIAGCLFLAFRK